MAQKVCDSCQERVVGVGWIDGFSVGGKPCDDVFAVEEGLTAVFADRLWEIVKAFSPVRNRRCSDATRKEGDVAKCHGFGFRSHWFLRAPTSRDRLRPAA